MLTNSSRRNEIGDVKFDSLLSDSLCGVELCVNRVWKSVNELIAEVIHSIRTLGVVLV